MTPTHAVKKGHRYRYYVSTQLITCTRTNDSKGWRIPAGDVESLVLDRLRAFFASQHDVGEALSCFDLDASTVRSALSKAFHLSESWTTLPSIKIRELVRSVVEGVRVHDETINVSVKPKELASVLLGNNCRLRSDRQPDLIELCIEAKLRRVGKGIRLVVGGGIAEKPDRQMIVLLQEAHTTRDTLMAARDETIDAMARRLGVKRDYLSAHMRVTYLAPDIVRALVAGRYPRELTPARLLALCKDLPHDWQPSVWRQASAPAALQNDASLTGRKRPTEINRPRSIETSRRDAANRTGSQNLYQHRRWKLGEPETIGASARASPWQCPSGPSNLRDPDPRLPSGCSTPHGRKCHE